MTHQTKNHPDFEAKMVLTSKHQKLDLIAPPLSERLAIKVREIALDTDQLGTFSGELPRTLSQFDTAVAKARMGIEQSGSPLGLASEGSIGSDPALPFINSDLELVVLVDAERGIVISEYFRSFAITAAKLTYKAGDDLREFLIRADFPRHGLIVSAKSANDVLFLKGISDARALDSALAQSLNFSEHGDVVIESDLRAIHSPSRRENIRSAAVALAARINALCPACNCPGWGLKSFQRGVACSECGDENLDAIHREILNCVACEYSTLGPVLAETIDPSRCMTCNP